MLTRSYSTMVVATTTLLVAVACGVGSGEAELTDDVVSAAVYGTAHGGDPEAEPAMYGEEDDTWAEDGSTFAYSHAPMSGRVGGGVRAEAADTVTGDGFGEAEARAEGHVTSTLVVHRGGRFHFQVGLGLYDLELSNGGVAWAAVRATVHDARGEPVEGGSIGELVLELRPDGTVVADGVEADADVLDPAGAYHTTLTGPAGGVRLAAGRYRVDLRLILLASAPLYAGPHQVAAIGEGTATIRVR